MVPASRRDAHDRDQPDRRDEAAARRHQPHRPRDRRYRPSPRLLRQEGAARIGRQGYGALAMDVSRISIGHAPPYDINVIVEIPQGGEPVKYELDKASGAVFVDRFLHTAMFYPGNYGFVPHTLAQDGDPIDVLIVGPVSVVPGAV